MLSPQDIEQALRAELPAELYPLLPPLAQALAEHAAGVLPEEALRARLGSQDVQRVLQALIGREIPLGERGDSITIGDIAHAKGVAVGRDALAIGDLTINLQVAQPATVDIRASRLVQGAALVAIIALVAIVGIVAWGSGIAAQTANTARPDPTRLRPVGPQGLAITALAAAGDQLWVGATENGQHALYQLSPSQGDAANLRKVLDVDGQILGMIVDCKGNLWILLSEVGTLVYRPASGERSTLLNIATTGGWLQRNTTQAIATRCAPGGSVDVWLGRAGVRNLRYSGDYPSAATMTLLPLAPDDPAEDFGNVRAMLYLTATETLWVANNDGRLLSRSLKGVLQPIVTDWQGTLWSLAASPDGVVWAGGDQRLIRIGEQGQELPLAQADGQLFGDQVWALAAGRTWLWFGERCQAEVQACWPLGTFIQGALFPVDIGARKEVRAMAIDQRDRVWIGTELGLLVYPSS